MRVSWRREDLARAVKGVLLFSDDQSDHMRAKLYAAYLDRKRAGLPLASGLDHGKMPAEHAKRFPGPRPGRCNARAERNWIRDWRTHRAPP
jgi:hypothetical protein